MDPVVLSESFFQKTAGWEAVQHARLLLGHGHVLSSNWTPPILKGVVQAGDTSYRAGLVIKSEIDVENLCTCRQSRELGTICPHAVAVGLHWLRPAATAASRVAGRPATSPVASPQPANARPSVPAPPARALQRAPHGKPLVVHVVLPPNFAESIQRGRLALVLEGVSGQDRAPLDAWVRRGDFALAPEDEAVVAAAEVVARGHTPGMLQVPLADASPLLAALAGFPRVTLGRSQRFVISSGAAALPIEARLQDDGTITLALRVGSKAPVLVPIGPALWMVHGPPDPGMAPVTLPPSVRAILQGPVTLSRPQVPLFLSRDWPALAASALFDSNFRPEDFELTPEPPKFVLGLAGGLAQLHATLQCAYGPRIMTLGVTQPGEAAWIPDPAHPRRYGTRDLAAEQAASLRLRQAGFAGPDAQGRWQLVGQDRVVAYFARVHPRLEREWTVHLEERLDRSTKASFERITPRLAITPSGEQWFDLDVAYAAESGAVIPASEIQQLLRGGSRRLRNGKLALIDSGAVEELQEILVDAAPEQRDGATEGTRYRLDNAQSGFLAASVQDAGLALKAPDAWRAKARAATGEVRLECPHLGALEDVLRPYQRQGVAWLRFLRDEGFGGVLADEMGLGKTLQVLAHLAAVRASSPAAGRRPSLVVCPTSLVFNWAAEARRFTPGLEVVVLHGPGRRALLPRVPTADLVVTSYALVRRDLDALRQHEFDTVILDEAQHIKNRGTQNAQSVKALRSGHRLVLTGTPLENSVLDLWSLMDFLMPGHLGSADDFRERYEAPIARERDKAAMARLSRRIRPFLLRRLKRDVAADLPPRIEQVSYCDLTEEQSAVYRQLLEATRKEVQDAVGPNGLARGRMLVLTALLRLRQACCDLRLLRPDAADVTHGGKVQLFNELLDEVLDGGHRALVFSQFTSMLALLRDELDHRGVPFCYLDGSTTDRAGVVQRFQSDAAIPVFLISLKAGGVGLNLTGADTVIHFDPWWNPAVEDQATDRAHRIGQSKVVTSYKLIARGTVEEKILSLQQRKRELVAATLTGEDALAGSLSWDEIQELLA
jgi:superfamily II DNA or RNA helicase